MPAPTITPLPPAPSRTDEPATFVTTADAFVEAMEGLPGEINDFGSYLDGLALVGNSWKGVVRLKTTADHGLSGLSAIDGVTPVAGDRILVASQSTGSQNGVYLAASGSWTRATDCDTGDEMLGLAVIVSEGTANADTLWYCTTNATITIGSTSLAFAQIGSSGAVGSSGLTMATGKLLGRTTASTGAIEEITVSSPLTLSGGALDIDETAVKPTESLIIACSDETTAITTGTAKVTFRMPYAFTLTAVRASVTTAPTGSTITIDINEGGATILSTKLSIDASEKTSTTAATAAVISDSSLADDAEMTIDFDQVGSTIAGAGVKVYLIGHRT